MAFLALVFAMGGFAVAANKSSKSTLIKACYAKKTGDLRVAVKGKKKCRKGERRIKWNRRGPRGLAGQAGPQGAQGAQGAQGEPGEQGAQGPAGLSGVGGGGFTLTDGSIGTAAIADGSITQSKLAAGALTVSGLSTQIVVAETADDSTSPKTIAAGCPLGKTVIGGGAAATDQLGIPFNGPVALSFSNAFIGNSWRGRAYETSATSGTWRLTVYAICMKS